MAHFKKWQVGKPSSCMITRPSILDNLGLRLILPVAVERLNVVEWAESL